MTKPRRRPEVGKWFFEVRVFRDYMRMDHFGRTLRVALIRLKHEPPEAVEWAQGKDYAGFQFRLNFRVPFYVERWR